MGKFEKGQWVRCVGANDTELLTVGKLYKIDAVNGGYIDVELDNGSVGGMWAHRFEAWQPKVGDRVQVNYGHGWEGEGTVDRLYREVTFVVNMETGKFSGQEGGFGLADLAPLAKPTTLTIEAGKFYKTRDGRKVGPAEDYCIHGWSGWSFGEFIYQRDGKHGDGDDNHNPRCIPNQPRLDIIAEWVDEPAASSAKASNDNAEPAKPIFKVGDIVLDTPSGERGIVREVGDSRFSIEWLHDGEFSGTVGEWPYDDFVLAPAPTTPAIVALIENGAAKPGTRPKVHTDQASATTEAERLALAYPGQQFGVFVLADSKIADLVNVPTAVLRAA